MEEEPSEVVSPAATPRPAPRTPTPAPAPRQREIITDHEGFTRDTGLLPPDARYSAREYLYELCEGSDYAYSDNCYPHWLEFERWVDAQG
ncbi:hypothetical protein [Streptomyces sp. SM12]|uniref:hypothetical protein n=1 Tax=Streptomyces sp. SM12 TaxID=1071602 RepID=UPI000CD5A5C0|nr:hypothetical protein [Streptomyces sp. SM12]